MILLRHHFEFWYRNKIYSEQKLYVTDILQTSTFPSFFIKHVYKLLYKSQRHDQKVSPTKGKMAAKKKKSPPSLYPKSADARLPNQYEIKTNER